LQPTYQTQEERAALLSEAGFGGTVTPDFYEDKRFLHNVMGDYLIEKHGVCKINGSVHIYENGIYKQGEDILHGYMVQLLPELRDSQRREVFKYIKVNPSTPAKELSPPNLIPFKSKIYDISTNEFSEYTQEHVFLNQFPYDYNPNAPECPSVSRAISEIASQDENVIKLLYETVGNCFYLLNSYRGAVMLYGRSGNNGKSTLLNMIIQVLGKENASHLSLQDTAERFRLTEIYGKAANIGDDIPETYFPDSSIFKKLVTGEPVMAEKKGHDPFTFTSYAKMFFAMNGLPAVSDKSKAFFSRVLLIPLNRDFSASGEKDVSLKSRIWSQEEMEYFTRCAVDGLKRLIAQGDFTRPDCVIKALAEYETENNPIIGFLSEYRSVIGEPTVKVYDDFKYWCERAGHKNVLTRVKFSREVCAQENVTTGILRHSFFGGYPGRCFVEE